MNDAELYKLIQSTDFIHLPNDLDYQVLHSDGCCFLLFQETRSKQDWRVNFNFPCKVYRRGKLWMHRGYANTYKEYKDKIMLHFLSELQPEEIPIISGWSFGASLAILAAEDYYFNTGKEVDCITFGGAKICYTFGTVRYLKKVAHITEYVQPNDFVTKVAPWCIRINAKKVGEKFSIKKILNTVYYHCNYDRYIY